MELLFSIMLVLPTLGSRESRVSNAKARRFSNPYKFKDNFLISLLLILSNEVGGQRMTANKEKILD